MSLVQSNEVLPMQGVVASMVVVAVVGIEYYYNRWYVTEQSLC